MLFHPENTSAVASLTLLSQPVIDKYVICVLFEMFIIEYLMKEVRDRKIK